MILPGLNNTLIAFANVLAEDMHLVVFGYDMVARLEGVTGPFVEHAEVGGVVFVSVYHLHFSTVSNPENRIALNKSVPDTFIRFGFFNFDFICSKV